MEEEDITEQTEEKAYLQEHVFYRSEEHYPLSYGKLECVICHLGCEMQMINVGGGRLNSW